MHVQDANESSAWMPPTPERASLERYSAAALVVRLVEAAEAAERASMHLAAARKAYEERATPENMERVRAESAIALKWEVEFQELWRQAHARWFADLPLR